jgi:hypothetical protein
MGIPDRGGLLREAVSGRRLVPGSGELLFMQPGERQLAAKRRDSAGEFRIGRAGRAGVEKAVSWRQFDRARAVRVPTGRSAARSDLHEVGAARQAEDTVALDVPRVPGAVLHRFRPAAAVDRTAGRHEGVRRRRHRGGVQLEEDGYAAHVLEETVSVSPVDTSPRMGFEDAPDTLQGAQGTYVEAEESDVGEEQQRKDQAEDAAVFLLAARQSDDAESLQHAERDE